MVEAQNTGRRPMVFVALAHLAGLALGAALPLPGALLAALSAAVSVVAGIALYRSRRVHGPAAGAGAGLLFVLFAVGWQQGGALTRGDADAARALAPWFNDRVVEITGMISEPPAVRAQSVELILDRPAARDFLQGGAFTPLPTRLRLRLTGDWAPPLVRDDPARLIPGREVHAWGYLGGAATATTPSLFNPDQRATGTGIAAELRAKRPGDFKPGPEATGASAVFQRGMARLRHAMVAALARHMDGDRLELARALILGETVSFPDARRQAFMRTGLAHLLAISGSHTAFVLALILGLGRLCGMSPRGAAWLGVLGTLAFAALTGFSPSITRAVIMAVAMLAGFALGRVTNLFNAFALCVFVTLAWDPRNLWRLDWQLSYACVLSVLLLAKPLRSFFVPPVDRETDPLEKDWRLTRRFKLLDTLVFSTLAATVAVWAGLLPLQLEYFGEFSLLSPLANLAAVPMTLAAMTASMLASIFGFVPGLGAAFGAVARVTLDLLMGIADFFNGFRHARVMMPPMAPAVVALYYMILLTGRWALTHGDTPVPEALRARRGLALRLGALVALMIWSAVLRPAGTGMLDLYFLDVGQGDGIVCRFPNGRVLVVDAGKPAAGTRVMGPFLRAMGLDRIDAIIPTHGDQDHVGGIPYLLDHFEVGAFIEGSDRGRGAYAPVEAALARSSAFRLPVAPGETIDSFEPVVVRATGSLTGMSGNEASVGAWIEYGDVECLLTGDMGAPAEAAMLRAGLTGDVEILKVGHHGSRFGSTPAFLNAIKPEIAVISVGARNTYGHPAKETLARLEAAGARVLRTDKLGSIWLSTDGRTIWTRHYTRQAGDTQ